MCLPIVTAVAAAAAVGTCNDLLASNRCFNSGAALMHVAGARLSCVMQKLTASCVAVCLCHLQAMAEWEEKEQERLAALASVTSKAAARQKQQQQDEQQGQQQFVAYVPLPDQKAIEQMVLQKKKQELLAKYTSETLAKQQQEAKQLLNKQ